MSTRTLAALLLVVTACTIADENPGVPGSGGDSRGDLPTPPVAAAAPGIPPTGKPVPIIVAQGLMGRTTVSCDDGQSWIANRSFDTEGSDMVCGDTTPVICGRTACKKIVDASGTCAVDDPCDCTHHQGFAKGVVVAQERIVASFGWGTPLGLVMTSPDGSSWPHRHKFADLGMPGVAYGAGRFIQFALQPNLSEDGIVWRQGAPANFNQPGQGWHSTRGFGFHDYGTGRFIGLIDDNWMRVSSDAGGSWQSPSSIPDGCTNQGYGAQVLSGNNVAVIITSAGNSCRSIDGGNTWTLHPITATRLATVDSVFHEGKFYSWSASEGGRPGERFTSVDGRTWEATPMVSSHDYLGPVVATAAGTFVTTGNEWREHASQTFLRSTDKGLTWNAIPEANYVKSHGIHRFASGYVKHCP